MAGQLPPAAHPDAEEAHEARPQRPARRRLEENEMKKPQRENLFEAAPPSLPDRKAEKPKHGYGSADEVKRRAAQGSYLQRWREERALRILGYDDLDG